MKPKTARNIQATPTEVQTQYIKIQCRQLVHSLWY